MYQLVLMLTERCNASCRHCCFGEGEYMNQGLDLPLSVAQQAVASISSIAQREHTSFKVSFSGGEVFLRFSDLLSLTSFSRDKGAERVACMTNGFWGSNPHTAKKWVKQLKDAGMDTVGFSMDDFHSEHIPQDHVLRAIRSCREEDLGFTIKCAVTRHTRRLPHILADLGNLLLNQTVTVQEIPCNPTGRATSTIGNDNWIYEDSIPHESCGAGLTLVLTPDGKTFPCCGTGWNDRLLLGYFPETSFPILFDRMKEGVLLKALREHGPAFFAPYFNQSGYPLPEIGYTSVCHLCDVVLQHPHADRILPTALDDWRSSRVQMLMENVF